MTLSLSYVLICVTHPLVLRLNTLQKSDVNYTDYCTSDFCRIDISKKLYTIRLVLLRKELVLMNDSA